MKQAIDHYRSIRDTRRAQRTTNGLLPAVLLALCTLPGVAFGQADWPRFRGPNGAGISDATTVPVRWTDQDYNWKIKLPGLGHSSPVLWGRRIYLTSSDAQTAMRWILCLDKGDGRVLWQREYPSHSYRQHRDNSFATATPAADADGVIVTWSTPEQVILLALDREGGEVWRRELGPYVGLHGSGTSPIIVDGLVILANDQEDPAALPSVYGSQGKTIPAGQSSLLALDRRTGQTRWQLPRHTTLAAYSTPCVRTLEEGRSELIFTSTSHGITAVDVATGKMNWELDGIFRDRCVGSPVLAPGLVLAGYGYGVQGTLYVAVRPGAREKNLAPELAYEIKKSVPLVPTALVQDGRAFLWSDSGIVTCLRASTGEVIWSERAGGSFYGSPVWVDGRLYCIARNGEVVVLAASDQFEVLARVPLGEASQATPAVAEGVMYLRTLSQLFSLGGRQP